MVVLGQKETDTAALYVCLIDNNSSIGKPSAVIIPDKESPTLHTDVYLSENLLPPVPPHLAQHSIASIITSVSTAKTAPQSSLRFIQPFRYF